MSAVMAMPLDGPVSMSLPFDAESAGVVRHALESWLAFHGSGEDTVADARLVATELVGNAVRHASPLDNGTMLIRWHGEGPDLVISVCDGGGPSEPTVINAAPDATTGRGLAIVEALSSKWWVERTNRLHTVHARLGLA